MNVPRAAPVLAKLDDALGRGGLNPVKKWWWDIALSQDGGYHPAPEPVNARGLQKDLKLRFEDQTLAVYPASLAPPPWPYPYPMDREAGIAAYRAMIPAETYRTQRAAGETGAWDQIYTQDGESPVLQVVVAEAEPLTPAVTRYVLRALDGGDLPAWQAGAHLDIVISPDKLRQYSLMGDPADRSRYEIAVLREDEGQGGSTLLHRIFTPGRKVFVSRPINHFPLEHKAAHSFLMGGGIGVTPMIAMAHELHAAGRAFDLHYSVPSRAAGAFIDQLARVPWAATVHLHISGEGTRADVAEILQGRSAGSCLYTCGPDAYMTAVMEAAQAAGFPEDACRMEYFSAPEDPDELSHPFVVELQDGRRVEVAEDQSAAEALQAIGIPVDLKCADGLCGVCRCDVLSGAVSHRDFVLSKAQREGSMILCRSRAAEPGGLIRLDL